MNNRRIAALLAGSFLPDLGLIPGGMKVRPSQWIFWYNPNAFWGDEDELIGRPRKPRRNKRRARIAHAKAYLKGRHTSKRTR